MPRGLFDALSIIRVYTKKPGKKFEGGDPFVMPEDATVLEAARVVHKDLADQMRENPYSTGTNPCSRDSQ